MSQILTSINNNIFTHSPFTFEMQIEKITEFYRQKATNYTSNPVIVIDILHVKKRFVLAVVVFYIFKYTIRIHVSLWEHPRAAQM